MNKKYFNESFLFLTMLESGMNSFYSINRKMFFISSDGISNLLFRLQNSSVISICREGVYLSKNMHTAIQFIDSFDEDVSELKRFEIKELLAKRMESIYQKSFDNELECLINYV